MKKLSKQGYLTLREGCKVIEADKFGDKVLLLADGSYLKLFRVKRLVTSARLSPYSKRFVKNAKKLVKLGVPTVSVIEAYKIPSIRRTAVHYSPLTGSTLRSLPHGIDEILAEQLGRFIRQLHDKGIYFRSLHLGNIVLTPENKLGLIDVADMRIYSRGLAINKRARNFQHLLRYQSDFNFQQNGLSAILSSYNDAALIAKIQNST